MVNTYGIHSINQGSFNIRYHEPLSFSRESRNNIVTGLRVHNIVLNILGYIPAVSTVSGSVRMATGLAMIGHTLAIGDRNAEKGAIIGRWYDEAIATGIAQIARGALEAFVPFGRIVNLVLDIIAIPFNLGQKMVNTLVDYPLSAPSRPHDEIKYPFPFEFLYLA